MPKIPVLNAIQMIGFHQWLRVGVLAVLMLLAGLEPRRDWGVSVAMAQTGDGAVLTTGYKQIHHYGVDIDIWYPSRGPITRSRHGPFPVEYAANGAPIGERLPVVVLSHGLGGWPRNHHLTARALVADGHVVVAPKHAHDTLVRFGRPVLALEKRIQDLAAALAAVNLDVVLRPHLDPSQVKGVGYSLGSASILIAAGARIDREQLLNHCAQWQAEDQAFCGQIDQAWWKRVVNWLRGADKGQDSFALAAPIIAGDISLVAPIGQGMDLSRINQGKAKVQILSLGHDTQLPPQFHAKVLLSRLGVEKINYQNYPGVHHYAFIAPFPDEITAEEDIPVAKDPAGFDRAIFLQRINRDIMLFLRE